MRKLGLFLSFVAALTCLAAIGSAQKKSTASKPTQDSVVITFKDGHTQSYPVADVARIEFESANAEPANTSSGHFLGKAYKTLGHNYGTWKVVGEEARITWDDGWRDTIRKAGNRYEKAAYHPGKTFSDTPDHIADASSTDPI